MDSVATNAGTASSSAHEGRENEGLNGALFVDTEKVRGPLDGCGARSKRPSTQCWTLRRTEWRAPGSTSNRQNTRAGSYQRKLATKAGGGDAQGAAAAEAAAEDRNHRAAQAA